MDEETKEEEQEQGNTETNTDKGNKFKTPKVITEANSAAERMEAANEKREELIAREEEMLANKHLQGEGEAGQESPKEETPREYTERVMSGELNG